MSTINLELRQIKIAKFASQETYCFDAALYLDGRKVAQISNAGHGGCDLVRWLDKAAAVAIANHFDSLPKIKAHGFEMAQTLEIWCAERVGEFDLARSLARDFRRMVVATRGDKSTLNFKGIKPADLTANMRALLESKHPGITILNGMDPLAAARAVMGR